MTRKRRRQTDGGNIFSITSCRNCRGAVVGTGDGSGGHY